MTRRPRTRSESGQATVLIIGLAGVLAMGVAVVTDASAAYLQRQGLDSLADGAALAGADLGASGAEVYTGGVGRRRLMVTQGEAEGAVEDYLRRVGARARYPGLRAVVTADIADQAVRVTLSAPLHLPLEVPGSPTRTRVGATGAAVVAVDQ